VDILQAAGMGDLLGGLQGREGSGWQMPEPPGNFRGKSGDVLGGVAA